MKKGLLRKAADLLHPVSGKYLNIDPRVKVKVGYFGAIDRETAAFDFKGDIYNDEDVKKVIADVENYPPEEGEISTIETIRSEQALEWNFGVDPQVSLPGLLEGSVKLALKVTPGKRAAFLIMQDVRTDYLPPNTLLPKLSRVEALTDMWVVTQVVVCSAYILGVTHKGGQHLSGNVGAVIPSGGGAVSAGSSVSASLSADESCGFLSKGEPQGGGISNPRYVTLLRLQVLRPSWLYKAFGKFGGYRGPIPPDDPTLTEHTAWMDAPVPWDIIDEDDGEEITPYDDPGSDDSDL